MKTLTYEMAKQIVSHKNFKTKEVGDCLEYQGNIDRNGYGVISLNLGEGRKNYYAHRAAYIAAYGYELIDLVIDHKCRNPRCVRPEHLTYMTRGENVMAPNSRSVTKINSLKTHCPKGHPLAGDNLIQAKVREGVRSCRTCHNARQKIRDTQKRRALIELQSRRETDYSFTEKF